MAASALLFTPRGTVGDWYTDDEDPGPSSSTYGRFLSTTEDHMLIRRSLLPLPLSGPDLWHSRRAAWLAGSLILNPAAPKVAHDTSLTHNEDAPRSSIDGSPPTSATTTTTTTTTLNDHPKPVLSAIQSLSAKARGKLPSFLHPYSPSPTAPKSPSPPLTSLEKLEMLLAEPGAEENEKVWRQGGLEAVWRMLTDSKVLKQPMRLGLVIQILKAGWIRDGTWPSSLAKDGKSRRAMEATMDDPFFDSPPVSPVVQESAQMEREEYRPPKKL